jgi:hypothetical protein
MHFYNYSQCECTLNDIDQLSGHFVMFSTSLRRFEDQHNVRVIISDECVYVVDTSAYEARLQFADRPLNAQNESASYLLYTTWLHKSMTRDGDMYSFGHFFGGDSLLLGRKFREMRNSAKFAELVGKKLKMVEIRIGRNRQYELVSYRLRE